jgi:hypothetical protein
MGFNRSARAGPTIHAFAHALFSIVAYMREALTESPPSNAHSHQQSYLLSAISLHYAEYEEVVVAVASLCNRVRTFACRFTPIFNPTYRTSHNLRPNIQLSACTHPRSSQIFTPTYKLTSNVNHHPSSSLV